MKIKEIEITAIGGIEKLLLRFHSNMNIICGPNGIGKTTILECIAHSFTLSNTMYLKRNANHTYGTVRTVIDDNGKEETVEIATDDFSPIPKAFIKGLHNLSNKLIVLKASRWFDYLQVDAIQRDKDKDIGDMYNEAKHGSNPMEIKNWFLNRYLYSKHTEAISAEQLHNLEIAKKSFSVLNDKFKFSRVIGATNEIMVRGPTGEIYYEYLSSGFKSCICIVFGIIKDIEFRFKNPNKRADEFDGIILIDEVELHLHPEWQSRIVAALYEIFPAAQFIVSTHSPHVLQNAEAGHIIALCSNDEGIVLQRDLPESGYGFRGWTIEEILDEVMGMPDTRTEIYNTFIQNFDEAIDREDYKSALQAYDQLDKLLHPNNHIRKLLKLEMASIMGEHE